MGVQRAVVANPLRDDRRATIRKRRGQSHTGEIPAGGDVPQKKGNLAGADQLSVGHPDLGVLAQQLDETIEVTGAPHIEIPAQ